jgi:hypothetical protein
MQQVATAVGGAGRVQRADLGKEELAASSMAMHKKQDRSCAQGIVTFGLPESRPSRKASFAMSSVTELIPYSNLVTCGQALFFALLL